MSRNYEKFLKTHVADELFKKYSLNEVGIWKIFGGYGLTELELVEGKLLDVLFYAVELPNFSGRIEKANPLKINNETDRYRADLSRKISQLKTELIAAENALAIIDRLD